MLDNSNMREARIENQETVSEPVTVTVSVSVSVYCIRYTVYRLSLWLKNQF